MALSFTKIKGAAPAAAQPKAAAQLPPQSSKPTASFMKTGKAAAEASQADEARREMAKAEAGKLWDFWMKPGEEHACTFLDGVLNEDGMMAESMFYQHIVQVNGKPQQFVCTASMDESEPCPLCQAGSKGTLVAVFTVIDHSPHTVASGPNAGKVIKNTRKLLFAKSQTRELLNKVGKKRGGLKYCTFDVSRTGELSPAVGNQFDFVCKHESAEAIMAKYDLPIEGVTAVEDYQTEITYRTPDELRALGIDKIAAASAGKSYGNMGGKTNGNNGYSGSANVKDEL